MSGFDILLVADIRFAGGTSSALIADAEAFRTLGARIAILPVRSRFLSDEDDRPNPAVEALFDLDGIERVAPGAPIRAETAFLHHPLVFFHGIEERAAIDATRAVLVAHQTPFRGDGSLEYDPLLTQRRIRKALDLRPLWAPISGLCRRQLESFAPLIRLTGEDWFNMFDPADWRPRRAPFSDPGVVIGRHGRDDPLKWPASAREIAESLPAGPDRRIRVMGCPEDALAALGADISGWEVVPFGGEPVAAFLDGLDVFSYHHHPRWIETFGRTVAEAALMGRVCIVDPALAPTFGDIAITASPAEVDAVVARLAADPAAAKAEGDRARAIAVDRYGRASVGERLARLRADQGVVARTRPSSPPLNALRKMIGLHRRTMRASA